MAGQQDIIIIYTSYISSARDTGEISGWGIFGGIGDKGRGMRVEGWGMRDEGRGMRVWG